MTTAGLIPVALTHLQLRWETPETELTLLTAGHYGLLVVCDHDGCDAVGRSFSSPEGHGLQSTPHVDESQIRRHWGKQCISLLFLNLGKLTSVIPATEARGGSIGTSSRLTWAIQRVLDQLYLRSCGGSLCGHFLQSLIHIYSITQAIFFTS